MDYEQLLAKWELEHEDMCERISQLQQEEDSELTVNIMTKVADELKGCINELRTTINSTVQFVGGPDRIKNLCGRLENWKFESARKYVDRENDSEEMISGVDTLARLFGNSGWFEGDMGELVHLAVDGMIQSMLTDDDRKRLAEKEPMPEHMQRLWQALER